ncbi:MAG: hypothetical protein Q8M40_04815 [Legionella sp.]|nr:hypothetical protein [Legionella sp.]
MNYFVSCCIGILIGTNSFAQTADPSLPPGLVKISKDNNPKCVEFIAYHGEMYCSLTELDKTSVDPNVLSYEKQKIHFDHRAWKAVWAKKTDEITTVEYIPVGENLNNWNELITTQFMPGMSQVTAAQFGNQFLRSLNKSGITYKVTSIVDKPNELIFEFKVEKPLNLQQDEIQKVVKGKDGMYVIHYAIKKSDMGEINRKKWIENIKKSTLLPGAGA